MKQLVRRLLGVAGFEIKRTSGKRDRQNLDHLYVELYPRESLEHRRFYNIGAGKFRHPLWTNVDFESEWYKKAHEAAGVDIVWDLSSLTPIALEDNSAEIVYTSHTLEHVSNEAAENLFEEVHRFLKSGGFFRLTMPNADLAWRAYRNNDRHYFYWTGWYREPSRYQAIQLNRPLSEASIQQLFLWHIASSVSTIHADGSPERISDEQLDRLFAEKPYEEALDHCISKCSSEAQKKHPGNHINWWNEKKLVRMLCGAGFDEVYLSGYGQSACAVLRDTKYFDNTHPRVSLYVECTK